MQQDGIWIAQLADVCLFCNTSVSRETIEDWNWRIDALTGQSTA